MDDSMPPPTPPATFSTLAERERPVQSIEAPKVAPTGNYRNRLFASLALDEMGTPTPSQWYNPNLNMSLYL